MPKKVSIIVPLPAFNDYIREAIPYYENLDYPDFELIILPDEDETEVLSTKIKNLRIIVSGKVGPAEKRDRGAESATGEILAFIDDDAYPRSDWLKNAVKYFEDENVAAVGGPAVTPPDEKFWQRISGNVFSSVMVSGHYRRRYVPVKWQGEDYDIPSVNLLIRKKEFLDVGGFDSTFYPGEDTKMCLQVKQNGFKMLYDPDILVYHHRRNLFWKHFAQLTNYAWHRGFFVKAYPETSRRLTYFLPSIFLLGVIFGPVLAVIFPLFWIPYLGAMGIYTLCNLIFSFKKNPFEWLMNMVGTFLSHLAYGAYFLKGLLFTQDIKR